jgi:hypothetical protein
VTVEWYVGAASREVLRAAQAREELPTLAAMTAAPEGFSAIEPQSLAYAQAGFFVRFLLAGEHAPGFRRFLAGVATGGDPSGAGLLAALGEADWRRLERGFRDWLRGPGSPPSPPREATGSP